MNDEEYSQEQIVEAIYEFAAQKLESGASPRKVESQLVQQGLDQESAATVVSNLTRMRSSAVRDAGRKNMLYGALWCIGGIVITVATLAAASNGGTYVVAWGAIIFGAIQFFRGVAQSMGE